MANGHLGNHEHCSNQDKLKRSTDADTTATSDTGSVENMVEYRIMMAYASRKRPKQDAESAEQGSHTGANGPSSPQTPAKTETGATEKKKKKIRWKYLLCIKSEDKPEDKPEDPQPSPPILGNVNFRYSDSEYGKDKDEFRDVASIARFVEEIANEIPFVLPDIETDSEENTEENVEKAIGLLLRQAGDQLNEEELKVIARELIWNYTFFKAVIKALLSRMGLSSPNPDSPGPHASPKTQIAVTCEATSRLSAMDTLPMNRLLGYGARYLSENYTSWALQHGGYDEVFKSDDDDDDDDVQ